MSAQADHFTLAVASGKGGTGKTLVSSNLAAMVAASGLATTLVDCDVEAPNDHLFFDVSAEVTLRVDALVAEVDSTACTACGVCRNACAYGASRIFGPSAIVFDELCHGCGLCVDMCPTGAMHEVARRVGEVCVGVPTARDGLTVVTGRLDVGQVKAPLVIRAAREAGRSCGARFVVLDAPPGVACSAVASMRNADALLLVTEPTPFGLHDLELSLRLGSDLRLPMGVFLNRDAGEPSDALDRLAERYGASILGRLRFDRRIAETYARGALVVDVVPGVREVLAEAFRSIRRHAGAKSHANREIVLR
ncbi:MAG: P-loop NTPase [Coriobacteriia bacterium]|nr:P-loop NTPase [Coriobacteriia bacterium]